MARIDTDQATVLTAVVNRLISQIPALSAANCYVSDEIVPTPFPTHDIFCSVCAGDGVFPDGQTDGGGAEMCTEETNVHVTIGNRVMLDQTTHFEAALKDDVNRGLLGMKKLVLKALVGQDPTTTGGDYFLRNLIAPVKSTQPQSGLDENGRKINWLTLTFAADFDWDLS